MTHRVLACESRGQTAPHVYLENSDQNGLCVTNASNWIQDKLEYRYAPQSLKTKYDVLLVKTTGSSCLHSIWQN